jgi:hypothetical protein
MVIREEFVALGTLDVRDVSNMEEWMSTLLYPRLCDMTKVQLGFDIPQIMEYPWAIQGRQCMSSQGPYTCDMPIAVRTPLSAVGLYMGAMRRETRC